MTKDVVESYVFDAFDKADHARSLTENAREALKHGRVNDAIDQLKRAETVSGNAVFQIRWAREAVERFAAEQSKRCAGCEQGWKKFQFAHSGTGRIWHESPQGHRYLCQQQPAEATERTGRVCYACDEDGCDWCGFEPIRENDGVLRCPACGSSAIVEGGAERPATVRYMP